MAGIDRLGADRDRAHRVFKVRRQTGARLAAGEAVAGLFSHGYQNTASAIWCVVFTLVAL
jgi:hypothetical protein